jgi:ABC-type antimicrobial peptide transport system permease subunit
LTSQLQKNYPVIKNELLNSGIATQVCLSTTPITRTPGSTSISFWKEGKEMNLDFILIGATESYVAANGIRLLNGRDIDVPDFPADTTSCLINETALKVLGLKEPLGSMLNHHFIVGVVSDFFTQGPDQSIKPVIIVGRRNPSYLSIRLSGQGSIAQKKILAKETIMKYDRASFIELQSVEDEYMENFRNSKSLSRLIALFTIITIIISCLGLLGISINSAEKRAKEMSIRKVLGAGIGGIVSLMTREYVRLVVLSIISATPLAFVVTKLMLRSVSYRTEFSWWIPVVAGGAALIIAVITTGFQSLKTALISPVENLRRE